MVLDTLTYMCSLREYYCKCWFGEKTGNPGVFLALIITEKIMQKQESELKNMQLPKTDIF